jgi:hypothetical protein
MKRVHDMRMRIQESPVRISSLSYRTPLMTCIQVFIFASQHERSRSHSLDLRLPQDKGARALGPASIAVDGDFERRPLVGSRSGRTLRYTIYVLFSLHCL